MAASNFNLDPDVLKRLLGSAGQIQGIAPPQAPDPIQKIPDSISQLSSIQPRTPDDTPPPQIQLPQPQQIQLPRAAPIVLPQRDAYQDKLDLDTRSGSGIHQIFHPTDDNGNPTGQQPGFLRKLGGVAATIGDTALRVVAPRVEQMIPGGEGNYLYRVNQDRANLGNEQANNKSDADLAQEKALTAYTSARPDIEQSKIDQRQTAVQERVGQAAAARGQLVKWDESGIPTFTDDPTSQAFADHQALNAMHQATADKAKVTSEIAQNHYIPGTPEWSEAQKKIQQADTRLRIAMGRLTNQTVGLGLRENDQRANFYGMGPDGQALPNAPQYVADDGSVTTGGLKGAGLAVKQNSAVGQFRDLGGSIQRMGGYLSALHSSGSDLSDPRVVDALQEAGSHQGTISTVLHSKLVKSGLTPEQVNAIAGLASFQEQLGTLRAAAKGTSSEAQTERMIAAAPTAGDTQDLANRKMVELQATYDRLSPSVSTIAGGASLNGKGGKQQIRLGGGAPAEGATKLNSAGDKIRFHNGAWGPA